MSVEIPVVDISPWIDCSEKEIRDHFSGSVISKRLQDVAEKWDYSFSHHGFAVIVGHGLLSNDMDNLEGEMSSFFGLEKEKKMKYCNGSYGSEGGGYSPMGAESVSRSLDDTTKDTTTNNNDNGESNDTLKKNSDSIPNYDPKSQDKSMKISQKSDPVESFAFPFPPKYFKFPKTESTEIASFPLAQKYYNHMEMLLNCLHKLSCNSLGINDENYLNNYYNLEYNNHNGKKHDNNGNGSINNNDLNPDPNSGPDLGQTRATGCALKFSYYHSPLNEAENLVNNASISKDNDTANIYDNDNTNHIRYGEHTDYLGFTILRPDPYDWTNIPVNNPSIESKSSPILSNVSIDNVNNCGGSTNVSTELSTDISTNCYYTTGGLEVKIKIDDEEHWVPIKLPLLNDLSSHKSLLLSSSSLPSQTVSPSLLPPSSSSPPSQSPLLPPPISQSSLPPSSFPLIVNAGDLMQMWTNDRWISPLHRVSGGYVVKGEEQKKSDVLAPSQGDNTGIININQKLNHKRPRKSIIFFSGPKLDSTITMLPIKKTKIQNGEISKSVNDTESRKTEITEIETPKYLPVRCGDYLMMKIKRSQVN